MATITDWMNGKTVLMTGGAGFFGKVLTEKLLRCCPGVKKIYLIIRPKFGVDTEDRWSEVKKDVLFEKLLAENPKIMDEKVVVLSGDMSLINLGLPEHVLEELKENVNIVFHSAATVRFNDPLQKAFLANTRGTLEMCELASGMKNLECFVYVSTTYCNHNLNKLYYEEKIYEPCQDWRTLLKLIETERPEVMNIMSYKIVQNHPNTYTFTKSLSEKIIEDYSSKFPMVIGRPPVVSGIYKEPIPGWVDNLNGVIGVTSGVCKGAIRIIKGRKECCLDYIPVDVAINALIVSAWDKARSINKELSVYNYSYKDFLKVSFEDLTNIGLSYNKKVALDNDIWYSFTYFATNDFCYHTLSYLLHVFPAFIIDTMLIILRKEPMLIKVTIKIYQAMQALSAFTVKDIIFDNKKFKELSTRMSDEDLEVFPIRPEPNVTKENLIEIGHKGVKCYYFKESMEENERLRLKQRGFYYLDRFVRVILLYVSVQLTCSFTKVVINKFF